MHYESCFLKIKNYKTPISPWQSRKLLWNARARGYAQKKLCDSTTFDISHT